MADTRINALSTATSSASDDFVPIDGTTNGTRKLSAYSPSFGGNATVGGTLTVNGAGSSTFGTTTGFSVSTGITVPSGGVGVGAVGTGGSFYVNTPSLSSSYGSGLAVDGSYPGGVGAQSVVNIKAFGVMSGGGYGSTLSFHTTLSGTFNEVMRLTSGSVVQVLGTTASTSTSSGALVVSGGVGVAGRMHVNGVTTGGDNETHVTFVRNGTVSIGPDSTGTPALVVSTAIKTSAPSGGTAANWKLGTVATVSPTSPNRTIEVDIGGTIYYIHAKTTNN